MAVAVVEIAPVAPILPLIAVKDALGEMIVPPPVWVIPVEPFADKVTEVVPVTFAARLILPPA